MSRFNDYYEVDDEKAVLDQGRWEWNAWQALKGKRGRKALADLREALMALPEHRLIDSAMCTVGGAEMRVAKEFADTSAGRSARPGGFDWSEYERIAQEDLRERLAEVISHDGEGVCAIGAFVWHKHVKAGMDPAEAFSLLPLLFDDADGDPMEETACAGKEAGLTYTLAYELAYRNDETYRNLTPEQRWAKFIEWIDAELASTAPATAGA